MKREDLKEGMIIEERDGGKYYIGKNDEIYKLNSDNWWSNISDYNENLTYGNYDTRWGDIVKIYDENMNLLWERGDDCTDFRDTDINDNTTDKTMLTSYISSDDIDYYKEHLIEFVEDRLGITLDAWQKSILNKVIDKTNNE